MERYGRQASPIFFRRFGLRPLAQPIDPLDGRADAEVADRQNVGPLQPEHQEHLRGPPPESFDRNQPLDDVLVGQLIEFVELQPAVRDARAKISKVRQLLRAQADTAERRIVQRLETRRR